MSLTKQATLFSSSFFCLGAVGLIIVSSSTDAIAQQIESAKVDGSKTKLSLCGKLPSEIPKPSDEFPKTRNLWHQPFHRCSIWNMPIGARLPQSSLPVTANRKRPQGQREYS